MWKTPWPPSSIFTAGSNLCASIIQRTPFLLRHLISWSLFHKHYRLCHCSIISKLKAQSKASKISQCRFHFTMASLCVSSTQWCVRHKFTAWKKAGPASGCPLSHVQVYFINRQTILVICTYTIQWIILFSNNSFIFSFGVYQLLICWKEERNVRTDWSMGEGCWKGSLFLWWMEWGLSTFLFKFAFSIN